MSTRSVNWHPHQTGAALVISMVLLLVLSILGIVAMNNSTIQAIMSANTALSARSLSNAEIAARIGEQDIIQITSDTSALKFETKKDHYYLTGEIHPTQTDWDTFISRTVGNSRYVIEYAGLHRIPGESSSMSNHTAGSYVHVFLVTSRHEIPGRGTTRIVQTVFVTDKAP